MHAFVVPIRDGRASPRPASASRTTASRWGSTASTTAGSGSTACGCRARRCSTGSPTSPRTASTPARSRTRTAASSRCSAPSCRAGSASAAPASTPSKVALAIAIRYADGAASSRRPRHGRGGAAARLRPAPAPAAPAARRAPTRCTSRRRCVAGQLHEVVLRDRRRGRRGARRRELESRAAGTKALGTWHATRTIQECREACGGAGYLAENRFAALKADTDVFTTFEGDNHVLLQLVAKGLLTDYSSEFEDLDQLGMVRFVAGLGGRDRDRADQRAQAARAGPRPAARRRPVGPGGRPARPEYQLAMLRFREEHMLGGVARRLKRGIDRGMNPGEVFSRVQDHVIHAARAHVERLVLEAFVDKVARDARRRQQGRARPALRPARADARSRPTGPGSWSTAGSPQRSKAISREIDALCRKIRPLAATWSTRSASRGDAALAGLIGT